VTRTVALTGATGFIGWHVARRFQQNGWQVRALVRPESGRPVPDGVERVTVPLREREVTATCRDANLIVHMAGAVRARSEEEFFRSNVEATGEVARAARALGVRLVHTSSLGATGPRPPTAPPSEDDQLCPINPYGESKRRSEELVHGIDGLDWAIIRPSLVYGPRDRLFLPLFKLARAGLFPIANPRAAYNVVHVDDVARGVEAVGTSSLSKETFFIGHPAPVTMMELMGQLASVFGRRFRPITLPRMALRAVAEVGSLASAVGIKTPLDRARWKEIDAEGFVCRIDKARDRLGFVATIDLGQGFSETAAWYVRSGWLPRDGTRLRGV
jgi:nucleoside-diphosphate-sugar epimerase